MSIANHNKLLASLEGCIGVKTGFTKKSGRCLVSATERKGATLICVTLNAPDDWEDHRYLYDEYFTYLNEYEIVNKEFQLSMADDNVIELKIEDDNSIYNFGDNNIKELVYLPRFIYSVDIKDFGRVEYILNGNIIDTRKIVKK